MESILTRNLLNLKQTIAEDLFLTEDYPWNVILKIKNFIIKIGPALPKDKFKEVRKNVWISKTAKVWPSVDINGPVIICDNSEIRHCAFIRSSAIVGENCVVGNSTEIKNSILFNEVQVPHYNYIGDSILGYKVHFGAGAITSNVKSDKSLVTINFEGKRINTGIKKLGAIVGDNVEIGCNSVLNPGCIIGRESTVYPLSTVRGGIVENSIYKTKDNIIKKQN